ncbi:MAG: type II secretion system F family protein [Pirellulales bacterium]|nr:type II secretion system F family protein [Pirellulales bacterium]
MTELFASTIDFATILPWAVFGLFAVGAFWAVEYFSGDNKRAGERLDEFKDPMLRRKREEVRTKKNDAISKVLEKTNALAAPLQPKTELETSKLRLRLSMAGFRHEGAVNTFLGLKFAGLIAGFFFAGGPILLIRGFDQTALTATVLSIGFLFYLPDICIWFIKRSRQQQIFLTLPDALDLLVVCVEAGLGLDQGMRRVSEELKKVAPVICGELQLCNLQLQMGRARSEVLHELGMRTGVDDLRALSAILIQADKFGSSVAQALRVQSDSMRTRRRQLAEEKAAKTAVKLIFPLVIFIFPGIFVVLVGPAAIKMVREMFTKMNPGG